MIIFNLTNLLNLGLVMAGVILLIFLAQELKRALIAAIPLFAFLIILVMHVAQTIMITPESMYLKSLLHTNIIIDFAFICLTFISYLWADDVEAKFRNIKSIDNSLDWLWKKV